MRTSDRLFTQAPIVISGADSSGRKFTEDTRALVLSRRGARIISRLPLAPEQKITIRCVKTGLEATAQVIGPIMGEAEGCHYGVAFVQPDVNIWGIHFPVLDGTEKPAGRLVLECAGCQARAVVHLDVFELEVFVANQSLIRSCARCQKPTLWVQSASTEESIPLERLAPSSAPATQEPKKEAKPPAATAPSSNPASPDSKKPPNPPAAAAPSAGLATQEPNKEANPHPAPESSAGPRTAGRKSYRMDLQVGVCLRHPEFGHEIVTSENISEGGFRIRSEKDYPLGAVLEAAVPYMPGAANIFTPARLVYKADKPESSEGRSPGPPAQKFPGPDKAS